jgi:hypothetical protein
VNQLGKSLAFAETRFVDVQGRAVIKNAGNIGNHAESRLAVQRMETWTAAAAAALEFSQVARLAAP